MTPALSIIIISYNTRAMTLGCLDTLFEVLKHDGVAAEVWVVDNASADGSAAAIREAYPEARVIASEWNRGFGTANNQAMARATGRYFLLLNTDAFPKAGALRALIRYLDEHPEAGGVGPRLLNEDGSLQPSCFRFPSPTRAWIENLGLARLWPNHPVLGDYYRWPHDAPRQVEFVTGACLLVRREVYERVGGFDERFFLYAEETDWQKRIREAGWNITFTPAAEVVHLGGRSGAQERPRVNRHFFESLDRYVSKHHGRIGLVSMRAAMIVGCTIRGLYWTALWRGRKRLRATAAGKARLSWWLARRQACEWRPLWNP